MTRILLLLIPIIAASALLAGCGSGSDNTTSGGAGSDFAACTDPRPETCTLEYDSVCGTEKDGTTKTYSTACTACSNHAVKGYFPGACR